jgi:hypothetical protein
LPLPRRRLADSALRRVCSPCCDLASDLAKVAGTLMTSAPAVGTRSLLADARERDISGNCPMIRSFLRVLCALLALGSGGCTFVATIAGSSVVAADERGGVVSRVSTFTIDGAMNMANSWCGQYGLIATETQIIFATDSMEFACIPPPAVMPKRLI